MSAIRLLQFVALSCLMLLCSCASPPAVHPELPAETSFNETASRGDPLLITLTWESGEKLLFMVDTGCSETVLDKSLETKLGKPLGTGSTTWAFYGKRTGGIYQSPPLYLGNTRLQLGRRVKTDAGGGDYAGTPLMGVLGIDCLRHYCIQLDFSKSKMRFLDPNTLETRDLGKAYSLSSYFGGVFTHAGILDMKNEFFRLDTGAGDSVDFMLERNLFRREMRKPKPFGQAETNCILLVNGKNGTNWVKWQGKPCNAALFARVESGNGTYTNLFILEDQSKYWPHQNIIGLRFFARHLVTFNFPKGIMYLKPESVESSADLERKVPRDKALQRP